MSLPPPAGPNDPFRLSFLGTALLLLLLLAPPARANVTGTVTLIGTPNSKDESFYAAAAACGGSPVRHTENWKVGPKGELQDVVVWIDKPNLLPDGVPIFPEVELKQIECRYVPHVLAVQARAPLKIINGDKTLHNIRVKVYDGPGQPPGADVFNFGQSYQGQTDEQQFDTPGIYTLQCDVHPWMQAWVRVLDNLCFAVTDVNGVFKIQDGADLADGDYKIEAWHPRFADPLVQTLHVKDGDGVVNFVFDGAKSF